MRFFFTLLAGLSLSNLSHASETAMMPGGAIYPCGYIISGVASAPSCNGWGDGSIQLSIAGAVPPYTVTWDNGMTGDNISGLPSGEYVAIVRDVNGCDTSFTWQVPVALPIVITPTIVNPTCGDENGSISVSLGGISGPILYTWNNGDTSATINNLSAGMYTVSAMTSIGCTGTKTIALNTTAGPAVSAAVTNTTCSGIFNGAINVTASGSAPLSYYWAHNSSTNEDLSNLKPGSYLVRVTDVDTCVTFHQMNVGTSTIDFSATSITQPMCAIPSGAISLSPIGNGPFTYLWGANTGGWTGPNISAIPADIYEVIVTDANGCVKDIVFALSDVNGATPIITSVTPSTCLAAEGEISVTFSGGNPPYSPSWSNGQFASLIGSLSVDHYDLTVTDGAGCVSTMRVNVPSYKPVPITLCMSTVDTTTNKINCIWDKGTETNISHFNIYRENAIAGQFDFWFSRPYDSTAIWTDLTANANNQGWRYKVTKVDSCGNESYVGINHKTIHVNAEWTANGDVDLSWDRYEGFSFPKAYIVRYDPSTGWERIDSVSSFIFQYTDANPPSSSVEYFIEVPSPTTCDGSRAISQNTARSNRQTPSAFNGPNAVQEITEASIQVYPNPANDLLNLVVQGIPSTQATVVLYDLNGKIIYSGSVLQANSAIDLSSLSSGFYFLEYRDGQKVGRKKIVVE
jgi:hypothetical protein